MGVARPVRFVRFGSFQLDLRAGELRRNGIKVKVPDQSIQVLTMLVENPREVVTREELHQKLWPNGTIVEFDRSINAAIKRLRQALEDSPEEPKFIETLPRRGYRFLVSVERVGGEEPAAPSAPEPAARELTRPRISHYRIVRKLGQGAMGVVYLAEDTRLGRSVALKFLPEELAEDPQSLERFEHEARTASALNHPNICTLHDIGEAEGRRFLAMEYLEGQTLADRIAAKPFKVDELLELSIQIADARTDLFSFGVVLYEMATGRRPFQGNTTAVVFHAILSEAPVLPARVRPDLPAELERIIDKALEKDREVRYQHAAEMRADLKRLKRGIESRPSGISATNGEQNSKPMVGRKWLWLGLGLPVALAAVITAGVWFVRSKPGAPETPLVVVPLTSEPGLVSQPSFSPDGNQVVYFRIPETGDDHALYVKIIGVAGDPRRLTTQPGFDVSPKWSPDGRYIAFLRLNTSRGGKATLLRIPLTGSPEQTLAEISRPEDPFLQMWPGPYLAWFPDGRWLVTVDRSSPEEPYGLFLVSVDTHEKQRLTMPPPVSGYDDGPALSPDGRWLAFSRGGDASHLYLLELSDDHKPKGEPRRITFETGHTTSPVWMPDGRSIVFSSGPSGGGGLWLVAVSEGRPGTPQRLPFDGFFPAVSRHGQRLVFIRRMGGNYEIWKIETPVGGRGAVRKDKLISTIYSDEDPAYSPDGKRIAFKSFRSGRFDIWVCDSDGSNATQLNSSVSASSSPHWSPDGQLIVFSSDLEDGRDLFLINTQGGTPKRLMADASWGKFSRDNGSFSRDGKWIYFDLDRSGPSQIWKMPADPNASDQKAIQVTRNGGGNATESPDGRYLYYLKKGETAEADRLMKAPVEGGEETEVLPSVFRANFAVADEGIYFIPGSSGDAYSIQFLSFSSRKITRMADIEEPAWGFPVSPLTNGGTRSLLYTVDRRMAWTLFLVENFR